MQLNDALRQIATAGNLNPDELIAYAAEDNVGGRDTGAWDSMSTFADEGRVIYALVRALKPRHVLEVGVASGGTSTHILSALEANGDGDLYSIDIEANCGINVPERLRHRWSFNVADALTADLPAADFVFEDGAHTMEFGRAIYPRLKALAPRAIVAHDYFTHEVYGGFHVKEAFDEALPGGAGVKIDGAFTGLGYWFNADYEPEITRILVDDEAIEPEPVEVPKPKRKAAK